MVQKFLKTNVRKHCKFGSPAVNSVRDESFCLFKHFVNLIGRCHQPKNSFYTCTFDKNKKPNLEKNLKSLIS